MIKTTSNTIAFDVMLRGKKIDTVFCSIKDDVNDVKKSLIEHDGYNSNIGVTVAFLDVPKYLRYWKKIKGNMYIAPIDTLNN